MFICSHEDDIPQSIPPQNTHITSVFHWHSHYGAQSLAHSHSRTLSQITKEPPFRSSLRRPPLISSTLLPGDSGREGEREEPGEELERIAPVEVLKRLLLLPPSGTAGHEEPLRVDGEPWWWLYRGVECWSGKESAGGGGPIRGGDLSCWWCTSVGELPWAVPKESEEHVMPKARVKGEK